MSISTMEEEAKKLIEKPKRTPWNKGKRKPLIDNDGKKWCDCSLPKLIHANDGIHQAYCLKCKCYWFN